MLRFKKAFRSIFLEGNTYRVWQILNKTPLFPFTAWVKRLFHRPLIQKRQAFLSELDPNLQQKLEHLKIFGYVPVEDLIPQDVLKRVDTHIEKKISQKSEIEKEQTIANKDFWIRLSDQDLNQGLTTANPLVQVSLVENILKLAGAYVKQAPYLQYVLLALSEYNNKPLHSSQLWHVDRDNDRMVKLFVYFSDVLEDEDGPFTFFPKPASDKIENSWILSHMEDKQVQKSVSLSSSKQMKGRKWTAFLCDTSVCYHMGSRVAPGHHRLMLSSLYVGLPYVSPVTPTNKIEIQGLVSPLQMATLTAQI